MKGERDSQQKVFWRDLLFLMGVGVVFFAGFSLTGASSGLIAWIQPYQTYLIDEFVVTLACLSIVAIGLLACRRRDLARQVDKLRTAKEVIQESEGRYRTSEERYRKLLEHLPVGVYRTTPDGRILEANSAMADLLGYDSLDALRQQNVRDLYQHEEDRIQHLQQLDTNNTQVAEFALRSSEGGVVWVRDYLRAVRDGDDHVTFFDGVLVDITEQKQSEQQLIGAKEQAEEMARLKSAFLTNMTHEVRTPLTSIIGFATVLEEEVDEPHRELTQLIRQSGKRLLETINSVLDFARLEANALEANLHPLDVTAEVQEAAQLFEPVARQHGLTFHVNVPEDTVYARADRAFLHRALNNLLSNAIKFTGRGSVTIGLRCAEDNVRIQVQDTGTGISAEFLPQLFEEFKQESTGLAREHPGSGLGLAITKRLVEMMHGRIEVQSERGKGSTFAVVLPRIDAAEAHTFIQNPKSEIQNE